MSNCIPARQIRIVAQKTADKEKTLILLTETVTQLPFDADTH